MFNEEMASKMQKETIGVRVIDLSIKRSRESSVYLARGEVILKPLLKCFIRRVGLAVPPKEKCALYSLSQMKHQRMTYFFLPSRRDTPCMVTRVHKIYRPRGKPNFVIETGAVSYFSFSA